MTQCVQVESFGGAGKINKNINRKMKQNQNQNEKQEKDALRPKRRRRKYATKTWLRIISTWLQSGGAYNKV